MHFAAIAIFVPLALHLLVKIISKRKPNRFGDFKITPGAFIWTISTIALAGSLFMTAMLFKSNFEGPAHDQWAFWAVYVFFVVMAILLTLMIAFAIFRPVILRQDVIWFTNSKLQTQSKSLSEIEYVYEDGSGNVQFKFSDGQKLKISRIFGGADAFLEEIRRRLLEKFEDEILLSEQTRY